MATLPPTPTLGITGYTDGQSGGGTLFNEAMLTLDVFARRTVIDQNITDPGPLTPVTGDAYIVEAAAVDAWAGKDDNIAYFSAGGIWLFQVAWEGLEMYVTDENLFYKWDGAAWIVRP